MAILGCCEEKGEEGRRKRLSFGLQHEVNVPPFFGGRKERKKKWDNRKKKGRNALKLTYKSLLGERKEKGETE